MNNAQRIPYHSGDITTYTQPVQNIISQFRDKSSRSSKRIAFKYLTRINMS